MKELGEFEQEVGGCLVQAASAMDPLPGDLPPSTDPQRYSVAKLSHLVLDFPSWFEETWKENSRWYYNMPRRGHLTGSDGRTKWVDFDRVPEEVRLHYLSRKSMIFNSSRID